MYNDIDLIGKQDKKGYESLKKILDLDSKRRDALLNAALKEFAAQGYDNASTNVIAREAGISKALMFHYVNSKQELFLYVYDYFSELLDTEYYCKMDYSEKDIFARLRQSYMIQIELMKRYPWLFEFNKLSSKTSSDEINKALMDRAFTKQSYNIFEEIDITKFRDDLDVEKCKQFILWANIGFTNEILDNIRNLKAQNLNYERIIATLDEYFDELRKVFYEPTV